MIESKEDAPFPGIFKKEWRYPLMKRFAALVMVLALLFTPLFVQSALADDVVINWYSAYPVGVPPTGTA